MGKIPGDEAPVGESGGGAGGGGGEIQEQKEETAQFSNLSPGREPCTKWVFAYYQSDDCIN